MDIDKYLIMESDASLSKIGLTSKQIGAVHTNIRLPNTTDYTFVAKKGELTKNLKSSTGKGSGKTVVIGVDTNKDIYLLTESSGKDWILYQIDTDGNVVNKWFDKLNKAKTYIPRSVKKFYYNKNVDGSGKEPAYSEDEMDMFITTKVASAVKRLFEVYRKDVKDILKQQIDKEDWQKVQDNVFYLQRTIDDFTDNSYWRSLTVRKELDYSLSYGSTEEEKNKEANKAAVKIIKRMKAGIKR